MCGACCVLNCMWKQGTGGREDGIEKNRENEKNEKRLGKTKRKE